MVKYEKSAHMKITKWSISDDDTTLSQRFPGTYNKYSVRTPISICEKTKMKPIVMPGYTHWQKAMPTDTNIWLQSFSDAIKDQIWLLEECNNILNQSPLGSAAGFGINSFENDRTYSAELMGFSKVQQNPMYCGLSRGLFEHNILSWMGNILMILSRLNNDILLFTTNEFSFMKLPNTMTTGSSIMPQKRNYDVCELIRSQIVIFFGYSDQIRNMYTHLMSGYQRDLQMTKSIYKNAHTTWERIIKYMYILSMNLNSIKINYKQVSLPICFLQMKYINL